MSLFRTERNASSKKAEPQARESAKPTFLLPRNYRFLEPKNFYNL